MCPGLGDAFLERLCMLRDPQSKAAVEQISQMGLAAQNGVCRLPVQLGCPFRFWYVSHKSK
ncbi:hypothetical protein BCE02nite_22850 [Brevibacillus centrosporus]|nr:hypothetical protein BCE02nite_22850 [Brevibacillus centrosporus]